MQSALYYGLQPAILITAITLWALNPDSPVLYPLLLVGVQVVLGVAEVIYPARPHWKQKASEKLRNITIAFVLVSFTAWMATMYAQWLALPLAEMRGSLGLDVWPHHWPLLVQLFMVFFASELLWYWLHRAEHRWAFVWRASGHGAHHSFKNLGAINFGTNHPLEVFLLVLPSALVELFFGVGLAAAGASILVGIQASIAHTNLRMNSRGIGLLFTTNEYHIGHHSIVLEESNTNYGCAAIVWDRVFGTFREGDIVEAGSGPTEPTLWEKIVMPFKEPRDTAISP